MQEQRAALFIALVSRGYRGFHEKSMRRENSS
jgi:hypothetical protein